MIAAETLPGRAGRRLLIIADHASNAVPDGFALGLDASVLGQHIAFDIGTAELVRALSVRLGAAAVLARASRLVIDCNRAPGDAGAIPAISDGVSISGNLDLCEIARARRIADIHASYHDTIAAALDAEAARLLVSVHSFTPQLECKSPRPWQVGLLYNRDDRAARIAMRVLAEEGLTVGDNLPYSGAVYGYTTDRHAEARGLPYLTFEIRQDLLADAVHIVGWTDRLVGIIGIVEAELFSEVKDAVS